MLRQNLNFFMKSSSWILTDQGKSLPLRAQSMRPWHSVITTRFPLLTYQTWDFAQRIKHILRERTVNDHVFIFLEILWRNKLSWPQISNFCLFLWNIFCDYLSYFPHHFSTAKLYHPHFGKYQVFFSSSRSVTYSSFVLRSRLCLLCDIILGERVYYYTEGSALFVINIKRTLFTALESKSLHLFLYL